MSQYENKTWSAKDAVESALQKTTDRFDTKSSVTGIQTHFYDLDCITAGLQESQLTVIAGRPSMGVTSFALNLGTRAAIKSDTPVLIFSPGETVENILTRMISFQCKIVNTNLKTGNLEDLEWLRISEGADLLADAPIQIHDEPSITGAKIVEVTHEHVKTYGAGLILIDYLQLLQPTNPRPPRDQEIADMTRMFKVLARETKTHVILLSQLNRKVEERTDKRPMLPDLRDSGAIEDDADNIIFLYRDSAYNKSEDNPLKNHAEIIIAKQHCGPTGRCELFFIKEYGLFENMGATTSLSELLDGITE
ncbi:hypothetical protein GO013_13250 [Pseudodesulfovibrio sp. JC047]|uniref:replicative DNA helicase n=1 Tax=Pseudodesulfovibrio sp. JC047 TaxID=2683199 RepID=UPI0013D8A00D|nr:DnaB-like helicase C-terminal domain-containing protein [Pseudodesulfovibrio sp. JC047]NDV20377.1 hypothetical protein [Pseudodesulfovibrio sp. JC047]